MNAPCKQPRAAAQFPAIPPLYIVYNSLELHALAARGLLHLWDELCQGLEEL